MKTLFILLLVGTLAGAVGWRYYQRQQNLTFGDRAAALAERGREVAGEARDAVMAKAEEWNLTPDNIKAELKKTGRIFRSRASALGETMDDTRITTVIKGKYVVEKNLSVFDISVECLDGEVKLSGSVNSAEQIGHAVKLALQTNGVHSVVSHLAVKT